MPYSRVLSTSIGALERARQARYISISLLVSFLVLVTFAATLFLPRVLYGTFDVPQNEWLIVGGAGLWLLAAYVCRQLNQFNLAGALLILLVLVGLGDAIVLFPDYRTLLLLAAAVPVALSALLLSFQAVHVVALLTGGVVIGAWWYILGYPYPLPRDLLIATIGTFSLMTVLALILAPLRHTLNATMRLGYEADRVVTAANGRLAEQDAQRESERVQQQLERQHVAAILEQINDGIILTDGDERVVQANTVARQLWADMIGGELDGRSANALVAALVGQLESSNGKHEPIQPITLLKLPRESTQQGMGATYVLLDQRERARLNRLRSDLLTLLVDEMSNPLASLLTALEMTLDQKLPDGADRVLVGARSRAQRLRNLVTTLLEINQMEEAQDVMRFGRVPLRTVIEVGIAQMAPLAQQNSVHVVVEARSDAELMLDKDRLGRAFANLLEYALRQSPHHSTINVNTQRQGNSIVVRVSDQGPGMSVEEQRTIFERDLSLTFTYLVVKAHDGQVGVESNGGQGSTFVFSLPLEATQV